MAAKASPAPRRGQPAWQSSSVTSVWSAGEQAPTGSDIRGDAELHTTGRSACRVTGRRRDHRHGGIGDLRAVLLTTSIRFMVERDDND
jgi:hypothetical protein